MGGLLGGGSGQQQQMNAIHGSTKDYQAYRQEMAQAMLNTLNQANSAYQGANNSLQTLYGAPAPKQSGFMSGGEYGAPIQRPPATAQSAQGSTSAPGGSPMGNAPQGVTHNQALNRGLGALFDPIGLFGGKGIGGLF
jgi:hypothetical protein